MPLYPPNNSVPSHTHPMNQITGQIVANYDPSPGNRPQLKWANVGVDTNSPNDGSGWIVLDLPWADQNFSYNLQFGAKYNNNPQGVWWRPTLNQPNSPWYRFWDSQNLPISSGTWTPILSVNNGASLNYTTQQGSFVRIGKMCHLSFDLLGSLTEGSTIPNNALTINSSTNFLPFTPTKRGANCLGYFSPTSKPAHRVAVAGGSNLIVFYKYNLSGSNILDSAYTWTDLLSVATGFQISGSICYEIA